MPSLPRGTPTVIQQDIVAAHVVAGCREEGQHCMGAAAGGTSCLHGQQPGPAHEGKQ